MSPARTAPLILDQVEHPDTVRLLYHHQAVMLDEWDQHDSFLLVTQTGTGKTSAAILPLLKRGLSAVAVYPTNELLRDQLTNISALAADEGMQVCIQTPDTLSAEYSAADVVLVPVDGRRLAEWRDMLRCRTKGNALQQLLLADKPKIVLTNPDVLFLIFALRYRAEALAALQHFRALVVDEFHLYTGVELAHALLMVDLGRRLGAFPKVVLLSATPDPEVYHSLQRLLQPRVIDATTRSARRVVGQRTAVHAVELVPVPTGDDIVATAQREVVERQTAVRARRASNPARDYLPAVVVLNSVVNAIRLEDQLAEEGFDRGEDLAIIRGLTSRAVRETAGKMLAIGTAAIEVGIDFRCDWLIFEASDAASFMQRFGRVGRHASGVAVVLCPPNVLLGLMGLDGEIPRAELEKKVLAWYIGRSAYAWFATTYGGLVTTRALVESILTRLREDVTAEAGQVEEATETLVGYWRAFAATVGAHEKEIRRVELHFQKMLAGQRHQWLRAYTDLNTFRTSLPSEWVYDLKEQERRGNPRLAEYEADIATLLNRAEALRYDEKRWNHHEDRAKQGMLTVKGYGRWRPVQVTPSFEDVEDADFRTTGEFPWLRFIQDNSGHLTPISNVLTLQPHVFILLPATLKSKLDWRLPVFECGNRIIAFDGAALLAKEIQGRLDSQA